MEYVGKRIREDRRITQEELSKKDNIFRKKIKCNFNNDELEGLIAKIENKWKLKKE